VQVEQCPLQHRPPGPELRLGKDLAVTEISLGRPRRRVDRTLLREGADVGVEPGAHQRQLHDADPRVDQLSEAGVQAVLTLPGLGPGGDHGDVPALRDQLIGRRAHPVGALLRRRWEADGKVVGVPAAAAGTAPRPGHPCPAPAERPGMAIHAR
jgi:hypothetical protein